MCNLYRMGSARTEAAEFFGVIAEDASLAAGNAPDEIYPGYPALVMAGRELRQMTWGFPLVRKGAKGQPLKPSR